MLALAVAALATNPPSPPGFALTFDGRGTSHAPAMVCARAGESRPDLPDLPFVGADGVTFDVAALPWLELPSSW